MISQPFNEAPCYVCGSIDCSSAKVVFDDAKTMVLCQYPLNMAILNTIDTLGTCNNQDLIPMFTGRWGASTVELAIEMETKVGHIVCNGPKTRLTKRGKNLIDKYNADFRRVRV